MHIAVRCEECGHKGKTKSELAGQTVKCPKCGKQITVSLIVGELAPARAEEPSRPPLIRKSFIRWLVISFGIVLLLVGGFIIVTTVVSNLEEAARKRTVKNLEEKAVGVWISEPQPLSMTAMRKGKGVRYYVKCDAEGQAGVLWKDGVQPVSIYVTSWHITPSHPHSLVIDGILGSGLHFQLQEDGTIKTDSGFNYEWNKDGTIKSIGSGITLQRSTDEEVAAELNKFVEQQGELPPARAIIRMPIE